MNKPKPPFVVSLGNKSAKNVVQLPHSQFMKAAPQAANRDANRRFFHTIGEDASSATQQQVKTETSEQQSGAKTSKLEVSGSANQSNSYEKSPFRTTRASPESSVNASLSSSSAAAQATRINDDNDDDDENSQQNNLKKNCSRELDCGNNNDNARLAKDEKLSNRFRCCPPSKQQQQQSRTASTDSDAYSSGVTSETTSTKSKPKTYRVKPRSVMHHHASEPLPPHARKCCYGPGAGQDSEDPCCCTRCEYLWPQMYGSKCAPHSEPQIGATRSAAGTFSAPLKNHRSRRSSCFFIGNSANGGAGSAGNKDLHRATSNLDPRSRTPAAAYKRDIKTSAGSLDHHRHNQHNYHRDRRRGRRDGKRRSPRTETRADRDTEIEDEGAATSTGDEMKKRDQRTIDELLSSPETLKLLLARQLPAEHQLALEARIMQMSTMSRRIDAPSSSSSLLNKS
ncbi:hypothetical protein TKK_0007617 [Trichogramma kaykai]